MPEEIAGQIDLRGHHLFSLSNQYGLPNLTKALRGGLLAGLGYEDKRFKDHITRVIDSIIKGTVKRVRLIDSHDEICKQCPQKGATHCRVAGKLWPVNFLSLVDHSVANNSSLEIGGIYDSNELIGRIWSIRLGIVKTFEEIPGLLQITPGV